MTVAGAEAGRERLSSCWTLVTSVSQQLLQYCDSFVLGTQEDHDFMYF